MSSGRRARCCRRWRCSCSCCSAPGSSTPTRGAHELVRAARPARGRRVAVGQRGLPRRPTSDRPPRRSCWASRSRSRSASRWPCSIHLSGPLRRAVYPLAVGSQAIPIAVIAPLLVFWWGFGVLPKLARDRADLLLPGARHDRRRRSRAIDPEQLKLLRTLDASRWQAFRFAELPAALPAALSGARIALAVGGDRRLHRRVADGHQRRPRRARPRDQRRPDGAADAARLRGGGRAVRAWRSPASTPSRSPSARSRRGRSRPGGEPP